MVGSRLTGYENSWIMRILHFQSHLVLSLLGSFGFLMVRSFSLPIGHVLVASSSTSLRSVSSCSCEHSLSGPVPPHGRWKERAAGEESGTGSDEKGPESEGNRGRPLTSLVLSLIPSVFHSVPLVPFFLGSLYRRSFLRYSHSLHAVGGSEARSGERFTVRRERSDQERRTQDPLHVVNQRLDQTKYSGI